MWESNDRIWHGLPQEVRQRIDELICRRDTVRATRLLWRDAGLDPAPALNDATAIVESRRHQLAIQGRMEPKPAPVPLSRIAEGARAIADPVVAIEAMWDGDTQRWGVSLYAIALRPSRHHPRYDEVCLCHLDGRDAPPFTGAGPRTPAGAEAVHKGSALARALGVPFFFCRPDDQDVNPPRWWHSATGERDDPRRGDDGGRRRSGSGGEIEPNRLGGHGGCNRRGSACAGQI